MGRPKKVCPRCGLIDNPDCAKCRARIKQREQVKQWQIDHAEQYAEIRKEAMAKQNAKRKSKHQEGRRNKDLYQPKSLQQLPVEKMIRAFKEGRVVS